MNQASGKVAVIGAGIVGVSTAIQLQKRGFRVVLIDRQGPAAGTSFGNAGVLAACAVVPVTVPGLLAKAPKLLFDPDAPLFLRWGYLAKLLPWLGKYLRHCNPYDTRRIAQALTPVLADCLQQHQSLAKGTAAEKFIVPTDYLFVYNDRAEFEKETFVWELRRECGFEWRELDHQQLIEKDPAFAKGRARFGIAIGNHGFITDPGQYVAALADHFIECGGEMVIGEVTDFAQSNGAVSAVMMQNDQVDCDIGVMATGIWSEALSRRLGVRVPMEAERGYHIELYNASIMPAHPAMISSGKFVTTPMQGRLRCAGIVEFGGLNTRKSKAPLELLKNQLAQTIPDLKYDRIEEWLGYRPAPTDSIPLIGEFAILKNMYAGFGHQHVGLTGGAKTGKWLAQMIAGETIDVDMSPYDPGRFSG